MTDTPLLRSVLWGVTTLCLLAGLIAIPVVSNADEDADTVAAELTEGATTTVAGDGGSAHGDGGDAGPAAPSGSGALTPPGSPSGGAAPTATAKPAGSGSSSATTAAAPATTAKPAPAEDLGPAQDPGPTAPPKPGTYRYKTDSSGEQGTNSVVSTAKYEDQGRTPGETKQILRLRGEGLDSDNELAWRGDGVYLLKSTFMFGESKGECDWNPDVQEAKLPLAKGSSWESSSSCTVTGFGPTPIPVTRKLTAKVVDLRRVRIAGQIVDTWVIEGTDHIEFAGTVIDRAGTTFFSSKHGLTVQAAGKFSGSGANGNTSGSYAREIQNLDPE